MNERVLVVHLRGMCENVCQVEQLSDDAGMHLIHCGDESKTTAAAEMRKSTDGYGVGLGLLLGCQH